MCPSPLPLETSSTLTKMQSSSVRVLSEGLSSPGQRYLWGSGAAVCLANLVRGSALGGRAEELRGRSVLIATHDQLPAALALIELDGIARRVVLCQSDVPRDYLPRMIESAAVDALVLDHETVGPILNVECYICTTNIVPADYDRSEPCRTEWVL